MLPGGSKILFLLFYLTGVVTLYYCNLEAYLDSDCEEGGGSYWPLPGGQTGERTSRGVRGVRGVRGGHMAGRDRYTGVPL